MLLILIVLSRHPLSFTYNTTWMMCGIAGRAVVRPASGPDQARKDRLQRLAAGRADRPLIFSVGNPNFRYIRAMGNTLASELLLLLELSWMLLARSLATGVSGTFPCGRRFRGG